MTQQELQQPYSRQNWQIWLGDIFGSKVQFETQVENIEIDKDRIKSVNRFASIKLADGKNLAVLDIETNAGVQIARNRVGLRELVIKFIDHARYHGILAFYHNSDSEYRLSFISSEPRIDSESGKFSVEQTAPKRFTYVLGEHEKTKTPADRLRMIADKRGNITLEDIKNAFSVETLTKEFYSELSNWYFWALQNVKFPNGDHEVSVIRMITRIIFVWFIKQKNLVPNALFDKAIIDTMLNYKDKTGSTYYKAILQNLFFATLNTEMGNKRKFVNRQSGIQGFFRYERFFIQKEFFLEFTKNIPFLNGGLFENLDKNVGEDSEIRIDCFSNRMDKEELLKVPDFLFFGEEKQVDLNKIYDTKGKIYKVRGLIDILKTYNFTIEENTPTDIEVALDPELLGKVFENLLASFNPETQTTARKQTGSFYTPREIVDYMVNESLAAYLQEKVGNNWENDVQTIAALNDIKILDPACGSGAFPMGVLQKMVQILQKLDLDNKQWREVQKQRAILETEEAYNIGNKEERQKRLLDIDEAFDNNASDYGRKLFLIENCIFGLDIQPIAVQIAKLRFFISLICEQTPNPEKPNLGIRPLPNLETKFVAANTLIGLEKPTQKIIGMDIIEPLEKELAEVRHKHFSARTPETKRKYREKDSELRNQIAKKLKEIGFNNNTAEKIAVWNPYDQNTNAEWFDAEWMFGLTQGFDIVIGNPPFIDSETMTNIGLEWERKYIIRNFKCISGNWDIYMAFFEKGLTLSRNILSYITPDKWLSKPFGLKFREFCMIPKMNKIVHVGSNIFENVRVDGIISFFVQNSENLETLKFDKKEIKTIETTNKKEIKKPYLIDYLFSENSVLINTIENSVFNKISDFAICEGACATSDAYKLAPFIENKNDFAENDYFKLINTGTIEKYGNRWGTKEITYLGQKLFFPVVNRAKFNENFGKSYVSKGSKPKVIFKGLNLLDACIDFKCHVLPGKSTLVICSENSGLLKYLCAIINSKVSMFYIKTKYASSSYCGGITFTKDMINSFPLPPIQQPLTTLVDYMLFLKNSDNVDVSDMVSNEIISNTIEKVIDACVYELYFEEEIKTNDIDVLSLLNETLSKICPLPVEQQIKQLYTELNEYKNEIRNRVILQETRSESVAQIIKSIHQ
jgi:hypothetical protein